MEVIFLKNHLLWRKGDKEIFDKERANYFILTGVAKEIITEQKGKKLKKTREDGVSTIFSPEEHDTNIKNLNKK